MNKQDNNFFVKFYCECSKQFILRVSQLVCFLGFCAILSSCTLFSKFSSEPDYEKVRNKTKANEVKLPFKLSIANEINDGEVLYVRSKITSYSGWDTHKVYLQLKGFSGGAVVEQNVNKLSSLLEQQHPQSKGKYEGRSFSNVYVSLLIPSKGLESYQLELIWGEEATESLQALTEPDVVLINSVKVESEKECEECLIKPIIKIDLVNNGELSLSSITLEVSFENALSEKGLSAKQLLEGKQIIEINDLNLPPATNQEIEFEISNSSEQQILYNDKQGLESGGLTQIPIVKILNYQLESE